MGLCWNLSKVLCRNRGGALAGEIESRVGELGGEEGGDAGAGEVGSAVTPRADPS